MDMDRDKHEQRVRELQLVIDEGDTFSISEHLLHLIVVCTTDEYIGVINDVDMRLNKLQFELWKKETLGELEHFPDCQWVGRPIPLDACYCAERHAFNAGWSAREDGE